MNAYLVIYEQYKVLHNSLQKKVDSYLKKQDRKVIPVEKLDEFVAVIKADIDCLNSYNTNCNPIKMELYKYQILDEKDPSVFINGSLFVYRLRKFDTNNIF